MNTAVTRSTRRGVAVDRKAGLMVMELKGFGVRHKCGLVRRYMRSGNLHSYIPEDQHQGKESLLDVEKELGLSLTQP